MESKRINPLRLICLIHSMSPVSFHSGDDCGLRKVNKMFYLNQRRAGGEVKRKARTVETP